MNSTESIWAAARLEAGAYPGIPDWLEKLLQDPNLNEEMSDLKSEIDRARRDSRAAVRVGDYYTKDNYDCGECNRVAEGWYSFAHQSGNLEGSVKFFALNPNPQILSDALSRGYKNAKDVNPSDFLQCAKKFMGYLFSVNDVSRAEVNMLQKFLTTKTFDNLDDDEQIEFQDKLVLLIKKADPNKHFITVVKTKIQEGNDFKTGIYGNLLRPVELKGLPSLGHLKKTLDEEFPWFASTNELVHRQLVMQSQSSVPVFKMRPILLAGNPGVGKTSWANRLAELARVPFRTIMAGGSADSMHLKGLARGWSSARPGVVVATIAQERTANPIFLVDELDKASPDTRNGRIWDVLLQLMEPATSKRFMDECLEQECDLSFVSWIATCNQLGGLPKPLLDRFTVVVVPQPGQEHLGALIRGSVSRIAAELKVDQRMLPELDKDDLYILEKCKSPREIARTVRLLIEMKLVTDTKSLRRH